MAARSRLWNISFFKRPKNPSQALLPGLHPFLLTVWVSVHTVVVVHDERTGKVCRPYTELGDICEKFHA